MRIFIYFNFDSSPPAPTDGPAKRYLLIRNYWLKKYQTSYQYYYFHKIYQTQSLEMRFGM